MEAEKPKQQNNQAAAVQPIEITEKPKPDYTPEAKALKIEGQVVVAVIFKANGEIVVGGITNAHGTPATGGLARLNSNGNLDTLFASGGSRYRWCR